MRRKSHHLGVEKTVQGRPGIGEVFRELPHNPGSCVEHLTYAVVPSGTSEEMGVLQNGRLKDKERPKLIPCTLCTVCATVEPLYKDTLK